MFHATRNCGPHNHITGIIIDLSWSHTCKNDVIIEQYSIVGSYNSIGIAYPTIQWSLFNFSMQIKKLYITRACKIIYSWSHNICSKGIIPATLDGSGELI